MNASGHLLGARAPGAAGALLRRQARHRLAPGPLLEGVAAKLGRGAYDAPDFFACNQVADLHAHAVVAWPAQVLQVMDPQAAGAIINADPARHRILHRLQGAVQVVAVEVGRRDAHQLDVDLVLHRAGQHDRHAGELGAQEERRGADLLFRLPADGEHAGAAVPVLGLGSHREDHFTKHSAPPSFVQADLPKGAQKVELGEEGRRRLALEEGANAFAEHQGVAQRPAVGHRQALPEGARLLVLALPLGDGDLRRGDHGSPGWSASLNSV
jgi:hypothetical protein